MDATDWSFIGRAAGYDSDAAIIEACATNQAWQWSMDSPRAVRTIRICDLFEGIDADEQGFAPIELQIANGAGQTETVRIIGIVASKLSSFDGIYSSDATAAPLVGDNSETSYVVKLADSAQAVATAQDMQSIMLPYGLKADSIEQQIQDDQEENRGFFTLLQSFMGLGLIVGIAAIGVISFRNVIERRTDRRAAGDRFPEGMVSWSFLIEAGFIVGVGSLRYGAGHRAGAESADQRRDCRSGRDQLRGAVECGRRVLALAVVASLITTWLPARQAASIAPAEALRYE